ncbi:MAG: DUF3014 domain-containing protein [Pseudomonadales bacterium]
MRIGFLITAIVLGLGLILGLQYRQQIVGWLGFAQPPPVIEPQLAVVAPEPVVVPQLVLPRVVVADATPAAEPVPELDSSDPYVLEQLAAFTAPQTWLAQTDLARRLAVVLSSAASGSLPRSQLGWLAPEGPFAVQPVGDDGKAFLLDSVGFQRFEPVLDAALSVSPEIMASVFSAVEPLLQSATAELGERRPVRELLNMALQQVLSTPVLDQQIVLKRPAVVYEFADPQLEALSGLQKQLLRMGPAALLKIQDYARAAAQALNDESATQATANPAALSQ